MQPCVAYPRRAQVCPQPWLRPAGMRLTPLLTVQLGSIGSSNRLKRCGPTMSRPRQRRSYGLCFQVSGSFPPAARRDWVGVTRALHQVATCKHAPPGSPPPPRDSWTTAASCDAPRVSLWPINPPHACCGMHTRSATLSTSHAPLCPTTRRMHGERTNRAYQQEQMQPARLVFLHAV